MGLCVTKLGNKVFFFLLSSSSIESRSSLRCSHIRHDRFVPWLETLALHTQSNRVGSGMHGGGLQTTYTHTKKKHHQLGNICLCILQLSVSLHWCNTHTVTVESTLLLYPDHLAGFPISTSAVYSHVCCVLNVRFDYLFSSPFPCLGTVKPYPVASTEHGCCIKVSHRPTKLPLSVQSLEGLSTMVLGPVGHLGSHGGLTLCPLRWISCNPILREGCAVHSSILYLFQ